MRSLPLLTVVTLIACSDPSKTDADTTGGAGSPAATAGRASGAGTGGGAGQVAAGGRSMGTTGGTSGGGVPGQAGSGAAPAGSGGQLASAGGGAGGVTASGGAGTSGGGGAAGGALPGGAGGQTSAGGGGTAGAASGRGGSSGGGAAGQGAGGAGATGNTTVWLAGDSTMANGNTPCPVGWGKTFKAYFNDKVTVTNSAVGGRSIRNWLYSVGQTMDSSGECVIQTNGSGDPTVQAHWTQMLTGMKAGDYLLVQFGINDGDSTCDRHVGLDMFKEHLGMMAQAAKDRGAQPVFITPVSSIACTGSTPRGTRGSFVTVTIEAGTEFDVPVIDLHALSVALYTSLNFCPIPGGSDVSASTTGPVGDFFCDDHTHFDTPGAEQIAGLVAKALKDQGIGLGGYVK